VRNGRTHGPDGENALHYKLFMRGPRTWVSGTHWKNDARVHGPRVQPARVRVRG